MAKGTRRKKGRRRGATARANAELGAHLESLGLAAIEAYKVWCRQHGFSAALSKTWQERRQERVAHQRDQRAAQATQALQQHVEQLGLDGVVAYQAWCRQQGLGDAIYKSTTQRNKELKLHQQIQSTQVLQAGRKHGRRTKDLVEQLWAGTLAAEALHTDALRLIGRAFAGLAGRERAQLRDLLLHVEKRASNLLDARPALQRLGRVEGNTFVEALGALARHSHVWQRPPAEWKPDSRNPRRQFAALARFLLARYEVSACLDSGWFGGWGPEAQRQQGWFIHVGRGQNLRTADLPLVLSKRMAHVFAQAPSDLTATEALRWAQVVGRGGSEALARAVVATELGRGFADESFWSTVVLFLVENPMLDPDMVGPIVDYINHQKYVPTGEGGPPQPDYAMKGRSAVKLLRQVEEWHEQLARARRQPGGQWSGSGIGGFAAADDEEGLRWTIHELTSAKELMLEGRAMKHCVASYVANCRRGSKSVWSLQAADAEGRSARVATIAVHNSSRRVVEVRGRCNAALAGKRPQNKRLQRPYRELLARSGAVLRKWIDAEELGRTKQVF